MRAVVFAAAPREHVHAGRSIRALAALGFEVVDATRGGDPARAGGPLWLVRAGSWPARTTPVAPPLASATGKPLVAVGAVIAAEGASSERGRGLDAALARSGGDLSELAKVRRLPPIASAFLDGAATEALASRLAHGVPIAVALEGLVESGAARVVRVPAFDVLDDPRGRVLLAVSSLQRGGGERVVVDLAHELVRCGWSTRVVTLGSPLRATLPAPPGAIDLAARASTRAEHVRLLVRLAIEDGADLVHAHLLEGSALGLLRDAGMPVVTTAHNTSAAWPAGLATTAGLALIVACSSAVERDLASRGPEAPRRTILNGIDPAPLRPSADRAARGRAFRVAHGIGPDELVLLSLANPRPQKRLERLPAVLAEIAARVTPRRARLVLVGDPAPRSEDGARALVELSRAVAEAGVAADVVAAGLLDDVAPALAAADVLVSTSAHEGLSLAHLEGLAAGLPVVATDVGGASDVAALAVGLSLVAPDAGPALFASSIEDAVSRTLDAPLPATFTRVAMAARHAELYPRVLAAAHRRPRSGLWLVTNNFSIGGAQSSARRLLVELAARGHRVRAAVLEEQAEFPTPGRRALVAAGVPVVALPLADGDGGRAAVRALLDRIDLDPPRAVVSWNALAAVKVRLADALLDVPVFDVSPGEMFFASLDRFFERPPLDLPYRDGRSYGARLAGAIVKFGAEAERARAVLGAPVHVVPNGVDLGPPPVARATGATLRLGTAARLAPQKRLEDLFAAVRSARARLPPFELHVAGGAERGSESYAEALRASAADLPIVFRGELADVRGFLDELDLFAMVSEPAGCPNASLEAMAAGLPVVATDVGGASEQVVEGETGRLVARADVAALAAALVDLAHDAGARARMGAAARARAEAVFSTGKMVNAYAKILGLVDEEVGGPYVT